MALTAGTVWEIRESATTGNVNGAGFNSALGGVDYSQQDTAQLTNTDLSTAGAGATTVTSAGSTFTSQMVGNIMHITAGTNFTAGWYEIVTFTDANNVILDRTPSAGAAGSSGTFYVGGAGRLNGLEDAFFEMIPAGSLVWVKSGSYTLSGAISIVSTNSTEANPSNIVGYTSTRADACTGDNRPLLVCGANSCNFGDAQNVHNIRVTSTASGGLTIDYASYAFNCKSLNTSTTGSRSAFAVVAASTEAGFFGCEATSQNGHGINLSSGDDQKVEGCYVHDCVTGLTASGESYVIVNNVFEANNSNTIVISGVGTNYIGHNTLYGLETPGNGVGINLNNGASIDNRIISNILYGFSTGVIVSTTEQKSNFSLHNNYYNNTTDVTRLTKHSSDTALNPQFTAASQITGTTATTSGSVLTQSGGDFSTVEDNVDFLRVESGTGVTTGGYLITAHTATTLTVNNALGTSSGGDVVYFVTTGHDLSVGTNLKAAGYPSSFVQTTNYIDTGAVQRQEAGATWFSGE